MNKGVTFEALIAKADLTQQSEIPKSYAQACKFRCWRDAMDNEVDALIKNDTYELVDLPKGTKALRCHWVYTIKRLADGSIERYKARLVVDGSGQVKGMDFFESFAPVGSRTVLRLFLHWAVQLDFDIRHWDVSNAFLNGEIEATVFMYQPIGFSDGTKRVCLLRKALYGLRQSPLLWFKKLSDKLGNAIIGICESNIEPCLWVHHDVCIYVYVDDILIAGTDESILIVKDVLFADFKMKDLGFPTKFLGLEIVRTDDGLFVSNKSMIMDIVDKFNLRDVSTTRTPMSNYFYKSMMDPSGRLDKSGLSMYQAMIGSLLYVAVCTRPDISYAVSTLSQFLVAPTEFHMAAVRRVIRYLKGTVDFGLRITKVAEENVRTLVSSGDTFSYKKGFLLAYTDSDFASAFSRRSRTGYCIFYGDSLISWKSKKQSVISLSSTEAELYALTEGAREAYDVRRVIYEFVHRRPFEDHFEVEKASLLCDNMSTIAIVKNESNRQNLSKHVDVRRKWLVERFRDRDFMLSHVATKENIADIFTKPLARVLFVSLREKLGVVRLHVDVPKIPKGSVGGSSANRSIACLARRLHYIGVKRPRNVTSMQEESIALITRPRKR